jgi:hypothetical protein
MCNWQHVHLLWRTASEGEGGWGTITLWQAGTTNLTKILTSLKNYTYELLSGLNVGANHYGIIKTQPNLRIHLKSDELQERIRKAVNVK